MAATNTKSAKGLYIQVLIGVVLGAALGHFWPDLAVKMQPFGDAFIKLVRMIIAPIIFVTVVVGIAKLSDAKEVGRIGIKAIVYFEMMTTLAMFVGLIVAHVFQPGVGLNIDPASLDSRSIAKYTDASSHQDVVGFLLNIIPNTVFDAFTKGEILQVLLFSVLFGLAALSLGKTVAPLVALLDQTGKTLFAIVGIIMRLAPIGAFGAMAFTVGRYGVGSLLSLGQLMAGMYVTCLLFVFVVLGGIARAVGFSIFPFLKYISEEILIVLGTSSSESALPKIMEKLERIGCPKPVVGLVVPTGYSFNLDGTSIYMTMAALFVAQASGVHLSFSQQLSLLGILLLTSKGAAAVTGSGFVTLAATLSAFPNIPLAGLALLLGVDRFMSEARAITNLIGNAVATVVVAHWDGALDRDRARRILEGGR
jgi:aerobic C4-dicarboxylate transport protein